ncbi:MAG: hypothetical protein PHT84_01070 [Candidatus Pacebacteria bacterium]|nr:hypothetical protein [Candidatus Paceibacterota bacterium]
MNKIEFLKDGNGNIKGVIFYGLKAEIVSNIRVFIMNAIDALKKDFYPTFVWVTDQKEKLYGITNVKRADIAVKFIESCLPVYTGTHYL